MSPDSLRHSPQLLAPANDFACARAALSAGADAVYAGIEECNLRSRSTNFSLDQFADLLELANQWHKKVYAVLNVLPDDQLLARVESVLARAARADLQPDAFIVADPGVIQACRRYFPHTPLHLSTQTGACNLETCRFWHQQGVERIILPREMTLSQAAHLRSRGEFEIELFIHGAMCVSIAGRCLLGAWLNQRHANFGDCPQPCRLRYRIAPEQDETTEWFSVEEDEAHAYILNSRDLNTLAILPEIIATGVDSLKIEGRNKTVHYVTTVVRVYRQALDTWARDPQAWHADPQWHRQLDALDHRPYTTGFYTGEALLQETRFGKNEPQTRLVGVVREVLPENRVVIDVKNPFCPGEELELVPARASRPTALFQVPELFDLRAASLERAVTNRLVCLSPPFPVERLDLLRRPLNA